LCTHRKHIFISVSANTPASQREKIGRVEPAEAMKKQKKNKKVNKVTQTTSVFPQIQTSS